MSTKRINIKNIVLGIIGIAIIITIGYGIARADVVKSHASLESGRDLGLRSSLLRVELGGDLHAHLAHKSLLKGDSRKVLNLKGAESSSLVALEGKLVG
jgi:hypothetical protein